MGLKGYKRPILMDVDGVIANFTKRFTELCHHMDPSCQIHESPHVTPHWNFKEIPEYIQSKAWSFIRESPSWWEYMDSLLNKEQIRKLNTLPDVLYVSSREGMDVGRQTNNWLCNIGIVAANVLIVPSGGTKYTIADCLDARAIIDDRPRTLEDLRLLLAFNKTPPLLLAPKYPYNAGIPDIVYYTDPDTMLEMLK